MPVASSQRKRFADGNIASQGIYGGASGRGSPLSFGWNFHREALLDSPAVLLNLRWAAQAARVPGDPVVGQGCLPASRM
jgi:hypothetical protein